MMALSLDDRYERYKGLFEKMIRVAAACEANGILYQVVMTDASSALHGEFLRRLEEKIGHVPEYFRSVGMEMVDVGGSRAWTGEHIDTKNLAKLPESSPCQTKGFYRPYYLHVSPTGDLRSCMYAPGSGSFGNIKEDKVVEIINRASDNPVLQLFASGGLEEFTEKYIQPWSHHYRQIRIPARPQLFWRSSQRRSTQKPSDWAGNQILKRWIRFTRNLRPDTDFSSATKRMYSRMNLTKRIYLEPCALDFGSFQIFPPEFLWAL